MWGFGKHSRMRCKAVVAPQCEHCTQRPTQQRAGYGGQNAHGFFGGDLVLGSTNAESACILNIMKMKQTRLARQQEHDGKP